MDCFKNELDNALGPAQFWCNQMAPDSICIDKTNKKE
jgi:hypothetical protein